MSLIVRETTQLLRRVARLYKDDLLAPGLTIGFLSAKRNNQGRRVMDGSRKKYTVPVGRPCFYGSLKRYGLSYTTFLCSFKATSILGVVRGLTRELDALKREKQRQKTKTKKLLASLPQ